MCSSSVLSVTEYKSTKLGFFILILISSADVNHLGKRITKTLDVHTKLIILKPQLNIKFWLKSRFMFLREPVAQRCSMKGCS